MPIQCIRLIQKKKNNIGIKQNLYAESDVYCSLSIFKFAQYTFMRFLLHFSSKQVNRLRWLIDKVTEVINKIYSSGDMPEDLRSFFIMLPKKPDAAECKLHQTISLMSDIKNLII